MRVGVIGLGKLGLPVAVAMASRGLTVYGYDKRPEAMRLPEDTSHEEGLAEAIKAGKGWLRFVDLPELLQEAEVVFVAVETPHEARFEGVTPLPEDRADFDYTVLSGVLSDLAERGYDGTVAVVSTVLPGTLRRIAPDGLKLVYNPSFIAMGTTIGDFFNPEFVLLGGENEDAQPLYRVYHEIFGSLACHYEDAGWPLVYSTTIENAELVKVAYNTFIGLKLAFANTLMEVCHKIGCDVDEVTGALKLANRRLTSGAYLDGGMGDGGACHPRDNIALSWLARELGLSYDLFGAAMECREAQARWLVGVMEWHGFQARLPNVILGTAYKPGSRITTGSPALLVKSIAESAGMEVETYDPIVERQPIYDELPARFDQPAVFLIGCRHPQFQGYSFPEGSVVIDPWRYMPDQEGIEIIRVGGRSTTGWMTHVSTSAAYRVA